MGLGRATPISTLSCLFKIIFIIILLKKLNGVDQHGVVGLQISYTHPTTTHHLTFFFELFFQLK